MLCHVIELSLLTPSIQHIPFHLQTNVNLQTGPAASGRADSVLQGSPIAFIMSQAITWFNHSKILSSSSAQSGREDQHHGMAIVQHGCNGMVHLLDLEDASAIDIHDFLLWENHL